MQPEKIWIDASGKMVNYYAIFKQPDINGSKWPHGLSVAQLNELGYQEITVSEKPVDYSEDTYYRTEQELAPYVVYERKSDEQIAATRWQKLKQIRDELTEFGGCFVAGKWFHSNVKSKQQQMALLMVGASLPAIQWKTMDGSFIAITPQIVQELFDAQTARDQNIFAIAETKRGDTSPANEGWPDRYYHDVLMLKSIVEGL